MPRAPKQCAKCDTRVIGKPYCKTHTPIDWPTGNSRTATAEHKAWRKQVLARAKGVCQIHGTTCTYRATEADHILPVAEGGTTTLDNGQAACPPCHRRKTLIEAKRGKQRAG